MSDVDTTYIFVNQYISLEIKIKFVYLNRPPLRIGRLRISELRDSSIFQILNNPVRISHRTSHTFGKLVRCNLILSGSMRTGKDFLDRNR